MGGGGVRKSRDGCVATPRARQKSSQISEEALEIHSLVRNLWYWLYVRDPKISEDTNPHSLISAENVFMVGAVLEVRQAFVSVFLVGGGGLGQGYSSDDLRYPKNIMGQESCDRSLASLAKGGACRRVCY